MNPVFFAYFVGLLVKETPERMLMLTAGEQVISIEIVGLIVESPTTTLKVATKVPTAAKGIDIYLHAGESAAGEHPVYVIPLGLDDESS